MSPFGDLKTLLENPTIQKTTRNPLFRGFLKHASYQLRDSAMWADAVFIIGN